MRSVRQHEAFEELTQVGIAMHRALRLLALGIDYGYVQFTILTRGGHRYLDGNVHYAISASADQPTDR
jgi:hypothetical protein